MHFLLRCSQEIGVAEELHERRILEVYNDTIELFLLESCAQIREMLAFVHAREHVVEEAK